MITQINPTIDPETRMWHTLQQVSNEPNTPLKKYLTQKDHNSLRTFVGTKMNFQPRFTPVGTFYDNRDEQYFKNFLLTQFKQLLQQFIKDNPTPIPTPKTLWQQLLDIFR